MEKYAKERMGDPSDVKFWYAVTHSDIVDAVWFEE